MKSIIMLASIFFLTSCTSVPNQETRKIPVPTTSSTIMPTQPLLPDPSISSPTTNLIITATIPPASSASILIPTSDPHNDIANLDAFASVWSTHDASIIRTLYTDDARYFTEDEMRKLSNEETIDVFVSDVGFLDQVQKYNGYKIHILREPIGIYDKLVTFAYRWENDERAGYNAVALLRYENGKILLHIDIVSTVLTAGAVDDSDYLSTINLDNLMKAWNDANMPAANKIYSTDAIVLSDEDLAQSPWRDYRHPPQIKNLFTQFAGWNPVLLSEPLRIDNMVIFAWRWNRTNFDYPAGYGVRFIHYEGSLITTDVRFAIRPWEKQGKEFNNP